MANYDDEFERMMIESLPDDSESDNEFWSLVKDVKPLKNSTKAVYQKAYKQTVKDTPKAPYEHDAKRLSLAK